jgi:hypothetical protein
MEAFVAAGAGFLLAVLWFDLMHDVQVRGHTEAELPEPVLASISGYYARVTTGARPMNRLVMVAMLGTIVAIVVEAVAGLDPVWLPWVSLLMAVVPIGLASRRTVPAAVRLGTRRDDTAEQSRLARTILGDHVVAFSCIAALLALQLGSAAR